MEIVRAEEQAATHHAEVMAELVWSTGPVSYGYHFGDRSTFDHLVARSFAAEGTLFGWDATHLAMEGDTVLGAVIAFDGPEFEARRNALVPIWPAMIEAGEIAAEAMPGIIERSRAASWLNPILRAGVYYIHAIAVLPEARGKNVGADLLAQALADGRDRGHRALELDVLSDNPAIGFYQSRGLELLVESRAPGPQAHGVPPEWRMGISLR